MSINRLAVLMRLAYMVATGADADGDGDGDVNFDDFVILTQNFGAAPANTASTTGAG